MESPPPDKPDYSPKTSSLGQCSLPPLSISQSYVGPSVVYSQTGQSSYSLKDVSMGQWTHKRSNRTGHFLGFIGGCILLFLRIIQIQEMLTNINFKVWNLVIWEGVVRSNLLRVTLLVILMYPLSPCLVI